MVQGWPRPAGTLDISQKFEIQERLKNRDYYSGEVDGNLGKESRKAIRRFQFEASLEEDGMATLALLEKLRK